MRYFIYSACGKRWTSGGYIITNGSYPSRLSIESEHDGGTISISEVKSFSDIKDYFKDTTIDLVDKVNYKNGKFDSITGSEYEDNSD